MTGPAAAARPLLRAGPTLFSKQLSGPAASRPFTSRSVASLRVSTAHQLSLCVRCALRPRVRLYSTGPDANTSKPPSSHPARPLQEQDEALPEPRPQPAAPELPSESDSRRTALSQNFSTFMDTLQSRVLVASQTLNDLTGYSAIEAFKAHNAQLETDLAAAQQTLRHARAHYKAVNAQRASTQREVTTLLARKDTWSPVDLERFTTLYRQDHELETAVQEASTALTDAEAEEARLSQALNNGILRRYHEEQIWSDRIRRQSTWGTWGLMGVNVLLFLVLQFVAEPWKRNRLMKGIAAEEKAALEAVRKELEDVKGALVRREESEALAGVEAARAKAEAIVEAADVEAAPTVSSVTETATEPVTEANDMLPARPRVSWREFLADPKLWTPALEDLYSERKIDLRMRDASLLALESAVTGAAIVGSVALMLMRRT